jgi:hypothetical protein
VRHWVGATWWDVADRLDLLICDSGPAGCRKKWSPWVHKKGRVDQMGYLHWDGFNRHATMNGMHTFMVWAAYCKNRKFRNEEEWRGLAHASAWGYKEAKRVLGVQIPWEQSIKTRAKVKRLAKKDGVSLRYDETAIFWWANWKPERAKIRAPRGALDG